MRQCLAARIVRGGFVPFSGSAEVADRGFRTARRSARWKVGPWNSEYFPLRAKERRRVEPYHLACISNQWYLIANDLARNSLRTFALPRIEKARDLGLSFERPADFSAAKMLAGSFSAFEAGKTETVRIRFDDFAARLVAERQGTTPEAPPIAGWRRGIDDAGSNT